MPALAEQLAAWLASLSPEELPSAARATVERLFLDISGLCVAARSSDYVAATLAAVDAPPGEIYNVGGGETASVWDILHRLEELAGAKIPVRQEAARPGDQRYTLADTGKLRRHLGWEPWTTLQQGLRAQWDWQKSELAHGSPSD